MHLVVGRYKLVAARLQTPHYGYLKKLMRTKPTPTLDDKFLKEIRRAENILNRRLETKPLVTSMRTELRKMWNHSWF